MSLVQSHALPLRVAIASAAVFLLATTAAAVGRRPHDPNLDLADAAIEKAEGLLQLTSCDVLNDKNAKECEKAVAKALADLASAREEVAAAIAASDAVAPTAP